MKTTISVGAGVGDQVRRRAKDNKAAFPVDVLGDMSLAFLVFLLITMNQPLLVDKLLLLWRRNRGRDDKR